MIRRFTDFLIFITVVMSLVSCGSTKVASPPPPNPMESIWSGIRSRMVRLDESHASRAEWQKASCEQHHLQSADEVRKMLKETSLTQDEVGKATAEYKTASRTIHFGFDCDYHALVFFDRNDNSSSAILW